MTINEYKGFSLFNDVEDAALRTRNRATVLGNIVDDNSNNRLITARGAGLVLGYFQLIPPQERSDLEKAFTAELRKRGWAVSETA